MQPGVGVPGAAVAVRKRRRRVSVDPWVVVGAAALMALLIAGLFGEKVAPHEPIYFVVEHGSDPRPYDPGVVFPFGSDALGRDVFSLVLAGAPTTLAIVLLGGAARVLLGVLVAAVGNWWRPGRLAVESVAELASAVPATLVALLLVKVFVKGDTTVWVFVAALLVIGWAGPYRVVRAEIDRLARAPFTTGAVAIGVGRWRLFLRHQLPHLVPAIAINLSQQIVASLVLVAELGVLGTFVGGIRSINVEESMNVVRTGIPTSARITDLPEWGGLLAGARTVEALWTTRWLVLVPGIAFALTAVAVATIGFALARRYARRDVGEDVRGRPALALSLVIAALVVIAGLVPERYAEAREWAREARAQLSALADSPAAFAAAGLTPIGGEFGVRREMRGVVQTGPATVKVGAATATQAWPRQYDPMNPPQIQPLITADTGGGIVEGPLVFAARGIVPSEYPNLTVGPFSRPEVNRYVQDYPDDYAGIDVRGKVVLLVRFLGIATRGRSAVGNAYAFGPSPDQSIAGAITRGAAAVLFVDPALTFYTDTAQSSTIVGPGGIAGGVNPYLRLEREFPAATGGDVPVIVMSVRQAIALAAPIGIDLTPFVEYDLPDAHALRPSAARELPTVARVEVPVAEKSASVASFVGEVPGFPAGAPRVLVWATRGPGDTNAASDALAAVARTVSERRAPFIFVDFDPAFDAKANAQVLVELLKQRSIALVVVLQALDGTALRFTTPNGDLIPAFDLYAQKAGAPHETTRTTAGLGALAGTAPLLEVKTVIVRGNGGTGDLRSDAAALIAYVAGRQALGAPELPR